MDEKKVDKRTKAYRKWNNKDDLLKRCKDRYRIMSDADDHNREDAVLDMQFNNIPGGQWSESMKTARGNRPCYEYNLTRPRTKRVVNDMRDNRPSGKVRGVEGGDTEIAEIYEGLIRNIANVSHMDNATDHAAKYQVEGGMGCWRVNTAYATQDAFDLDLVIEEIENPYALYCDPSAKNSMKRDARDWVYTERIAVEEYEETYGKEAPAVDFDAHNEGDDGFNDDWTNEETVRIAEYWYKVPTKKILWLVDVPDPESDKGETKRLVVDSESDEAAGIPEEAIYEKREVDTHKIMMFICDGSEILEGPTEWPGSIFPWVMVMGEEVVIEGRHYWWGMIRHAKDAQRNFNVSKTAIAETIAQTPKSKWWATTTQAKGHQGEWAVADRENFPFMLYSPDPQAPGPPVRMGPADVPNALMIQSETDHGDLKDVMGSPDSQMGAQGDEKSGRAIYARQQQGEIINFDYRDNMNKAVELTYEILIDLIPTIYDTERELRVIGKDGSEAYHKVNQTVPVGDKTIRINDLSMGKYDVTVTSGPSFSTQRQEAAEIYMQMTQGMPEAMQLFGDLIFNAVDLPYSDEIAERIKAMLPPQIQQMLNEDEEVPPEVQQMMQQAQQMMQQVEEYSKVVETAAQEVQQDSASSDIKKSEVKVEIANLGKARAEFEKKIAESLAALAEKGAGVTTQRAELAVKGAEVKEAAIASDVALMSGLEDVPGRIDKVDKLVAGFMRSADKAVGDMKSKAARQDIALNRKVIGGKTTRIGGKLTADVQFDDGTSQRITAVREGGELRIIPSEADPEGEAGPPTT